MALPPRRGRAARAGFQHGYLLGPEIADGIRTTKVIWEHLSAMEWSWLVDRAHPMPTGKIDPENLAELDGMADILKSR